jgi:hypothetical protein
MIDRECFRFSRVTQHLCPLADYPASVLTRIAPSLQVVTTNVESPDPPKTPAVSFNEMNHVGVKMPDGCAVEYMPPLHYETYNDLPPSLLDFYATGVVLRIRHQTHNEVLLKALAAPSIAMTSIVPVVCSTPTLLVQLLIALFLIIEPIRPTNIQSQSLPIDFWFNSMDPNSPHTQAHANFSVVLHRLLTYVSETNQVESFTDTWLKLLLAEFNNGFSHSVHPSHPSAVVLPFCDIPSCSCVSHPGATAWVVLQSGFSGTNTSNAVIMPEDRSTDFILSDNVICISGEKFYVTVRSRFSQRSLIAIPFVGGRNDHLFGTVFDLLISLKYFVLYVKMRLNSYPPAFVQSAKTKLYKAYFDSLIVRSPFFVSFGNEILQFLQQNLPLTTADLTPDVIVHLSLLAIYCQSEGFEYIRQFVEEQQNVLDEVYIFGGQDFVNEFFAPLDGDGRDSTASPEVFQPAFPMTVTMNENFPKILANLKRVLGRPKDIQSCPFHLLLHRWVHYSTVCPPVESTIVNRRVCRLKFTSYVPHTFRLIFAQHTPTFRFCVGFDPNFHNARHVSPTSRIHTSGNPEVYIRIEGDEGLSFNHLLFYIRSDNEVSIADFIRDFRSRFILDAKTFFIHWEPRFDQAILRCYPVKPYSKSSLALDFDPVRLLWSQVHYPMHLLCCRCFFLMILNFYYCHHHEELSKNASLQVFLPSVAMKVKITRLRQLIAKSNGVEGDFIRINRKSAFEVRDGQSKRLHFTLIAQLTQLYTSPAHFRVPGDKPWKVHLIGEQGCDVGGLARELVAEAAADLMAPSCGLVVPIPDARNDIGNNRSLMIPIPNPRHLNISRQYHFVGALIAIAIRSGLPQEFNFPPFFWEYMMTGQLNVEAIFDIDHKFFSLITSLKQAVKTATNPAAAIERFNLRFVVQNSLGKEVFLTSKGMDEFVTAENCEQYIALAIDYRVNEMKPYLDEISGGLWENFNLKPPKFLDSSTLEYAACGEKGVLIESLKKVTTFYDVPEDQQAYFWAVVEHFSNEQRSLLLKFVTGRSRLPVHQTHVPFLKVDFTFGDTDRMPTASTCFGRLHLPRYTSVEKARKLMMLAIEYAGTFEMG